MVVIVWVVVPSLVECVSLMLRCGDVDMDIDIDWANEHGLCEVLLQGESEVSDLELLREFEGCVGVILAIFLSGARNPFVDRRCIWAVAPPA